MPQGQRTSRSESVLERFLDPIDHVLRFKLDAFLQNALGMEQVLQRHYLESRSHSFRIICERLKTLIKLICIMHVKITTTSWLWLALAFFLLRLGFGASSSPRPKAWWSGLRVAAWAAVNTVSIPHTDFATQKTSTVIAVVQSLVRCWWDEARCDESLEKRF